MFFNIVALSLLCHYKTNDLTNMETFTQIILPISFACISTYLLGSICRLFIHLLINEHGND